MLSNLLSAGNLIICTQFMSKKYINGSKVHTYVLILTLLINASKVHSYNLDNGMHSML